MSAAKIGELTRRVVLEDLVRTPDEAGGAVESWTAIATLFAAVRALSGSEGARFDRIDARVTHEIVIRHRSDVRPAMRFRLGPRLFEIIAARDDDGRRRHLTCLVEERDL
ncbi:MAG: phage head closure protein [Hyphomicrobiaceae bacterium]